MTDHPQPSSDEADPDKQATPAGLAHELEAEAAEEGAVVTPDDPKT